jgi:ribosomal protein S27AE
MTRRPYVCPRCGAESFNTHDIVYRYCGRCHQFEDLASLKSELDSLRREPGSQGGARAGLAALRRPSGPPGAKGPSAGRYEPS